MKNSSNGKSSNEKFSINFDITNFTNFDDKHEFHLFEINNIESDSSIDGKTNF